MAFSTSSASRWMTSATACPRRVPSIGGHELDPRVLLDLGDGRAQHLGHGDRVAPLAAGDGAAEHGEVLGVPADAGGEVVDVEEALEQVGVLDLVSPARRGCWISRCTRDWSRRARLTKTSTFCSLPAWLESCEAWTTAVTAPSWARARSAPRSSKSSASAAGAPPCPAGRRRVAAAQPLDQGPQFHLAAGAGAAQGTEAFVHGSGGAVGGHQGDDDAAERHGDRPGEHGEQGERGPHPGGADDEQDGRAGAEADREGRQHGEPHELGPYLGLGQ